MQSTVTRTRVGFMGERCDLQLVSAWSVTYYSWHRLVRDAHTSREVPTSHSILVRMRLDPDWQIALRQSLSARDGAEWRYRRLWAGQQPQQQRDGVVAPCRRPSCQPSYNWRAVFSHDDTLITRRRSKQPSLSWSTFRATSISALLCHSNRTCTPPAPTTLVRHVIISSERLAAWPCTNFSRLSPANCCDVFLHYNYRHLSLSVQR